MHNLPAHHLSNTLISTSYLCRPAWSSASSRRTASPFDSWHELKWPSKPNSQSKEKTGRARSSPPPKVAVALLPYKRLATSGGGGGGGRVGWEGKNLTRSGVRPLSILRRFVAARHSGAEPESRTMSGLSLHGIPRPTGTEQPGARPAAPEHPPVARRERPVNTSKPLRHPFLKLLVL